MSEFHELRVGDHIALLSGHPFNSEYFDQEEGVRLIRIRDLLNPDGETYFRGLFDPKWVVKSQDILIGMDGDFNIVRWQGNEALLNQRILKAEARPNGLIDEDYFFYWCAPLLQQIHNQTAATTVKHLSVKDIERARGQFPDKRSQARIAKILSTLDEAIEQTEALIAKMQQIKAGLMHDLFTRGVTPDGHLRPTREQAPDLYKESPLGWIPKDWDIVTIVESAAKTQGSTTIGPFGSNLVSSDYRNEGVPVVFVRDVKEDAFEWNSNVYVTPQKAQQLGAHTVRPGDLVSTKMGLPPCITCAYPDWMEEGLITADIIRLRPDNNRFYTRWLSAALNCDAFKRQVQAITAGVTRPKVTLSEFRKLRIPCPGIQEQERVATRFEALGEVLSSEVAKLNKLQEEKHGLMHDLLIDNVRVVEGAVHLLEF